MTAPVAGPGRFGRPPVGDSLGVHFCSLSGGYGTSGTSAE